MISNVDFQKLKEYDCINFLVMCEPYILPRVTNKNITAGEIESTYHNTLIITNKNNSIAEDIRIALYRDGGEKFLEKALQLQLACEAFIRENASDLGKKSMNLIFYTKGNKVEDFTNEQFGQAADLNSLLTVMLSCKYISIAKQSQWNIVTSQSKLEEILKESIKKSVDANLIFK